jgi:hypothetical protein
MAIEGIGRLFNVVPIAKAAGLRMREAEAVTFVCTGADTFSVTIAQTFAGTYRAGSFFSPAWTPISRYYQASATNGTAAWTRVNQAAADNIVQAGAGTTLFTIFAVALPDTYTYIKCGAAGAGLVAAIFSDLDDQRAPANLPIMSA